MTNSTTQQRHGTPALDQMVRTTALFNLLFMVVSSTPWFSGTAEAPGLLDRLFNHLRFAGWRADLLWLGTCNLIFFCVFIASIVHLRRAYARINAALTLATMVAFFFYMRFLLHSGLLYMG